MSTRRTLLEAAGVVFAQHGYVAATSQEICEGAAANAGAVNYHFGGKRGLYAAVLEEAQHRLVRIDARAAALSNVDPLAWLRMLLTRIVTEIARGAGGAWELRVLAHELMSPSPLIDELVNNQLSPNAKVARAKLAEIMALPIEHPAVSRSIVSAIGPCILLAIANKDLQRKVAPQLELDNGSLAQHMLTFVLAGLGAVAREAKQTASPLRMVE